MKHSVIAISCVGFFLAAAPAFATHALCLNCGEMHFGALTACRNCSFNPMEEAQKDGSFFQLCLLFSDHNLSPKTLEDHGRIVKALRPVFPDVVERSWALSYYLAEFNPNGKKLFKQFMLPPELRQKIPDAVNKLNLPILPVERGMSR